MAAARAEPKPLDHTLPTPWGFVGAPAIGESVLALARQSVGTWRKVDDTYDVPQVRTGQAGRYRQAQAGPYRRITLERMGVSAADWGLILNCLYLASLGGVRNSVLVWDESRPRGSSTAPSTPDCHYPSTWPRRTCRTRSRSPATRPQSGRRSGRACSRL